MRFVWLAIFCLAPTVGIAQNVKVISGEHVDFSRLVVLFSTPPEWTFGRVAGGYEFRPTDLNANYDLDSVFNYIPKDRITEIKSRSGGRLFLQVDCTCHADAFEIRQGIVLDIKDGPSPQTALFETMLTDLSDEDAPSAPEQPNARRWSSAFDPDLASPDAFRTEPNLTPFSWTGDLDSPTTVFARNETNTGGMAIPDSDEQPPLEEQVQSIQEELIAQLGRAASQGVIRAEPSALGPEFEKPEPSVEEEIPPSPENPVADVPHSPSSIDILSETPNVTIETAVDRGMTRTDEIVPLAQDGASCISDDRLDIPKWGVPPNGETIFATHRDAIVGEFDVADPASIATVSRNYIYLTFGLEARALIQAFETVFPDQALYEALAKIVDGDVPDPENPLRGQISCPGRAALWAALSVDRLEPADQIDTDAVVSAFSELPVHLRLHLGPALVSRFLEIEDTRTATALRNALARAPIDHGEEMHSIDAALALKSGNSTDATREFTRIIEQDGPMAADALIKLVETLIDQGEPVPPEIRQNAAALAFSNRGTELGTDLERAYLRAVAHGGDLKEGLAELLRREDHLPDALHAELLAEFHSRIADVATPETFLTSVLPGPLAFGQGEKSDSARRAVAERLLALGFSEAARAQLSQDQSVPTTDDRLLYARAYLVEKRPDLVIGYLAGLDSTVARRLRAQAHELAGQYDLAADLYAAIGDVEAQANAVWRSRDWEKAALLKGGTEAEAAALVVAETAAGRIDVDEPQGNDAPVAVTENEPASTDNPSGDTAPDNASFADMAPLARSRELLKESREARRVLEALMDESMPSP